MFSSEICGLRYTSVFLSRGSGVLYRSDVLYHSRFCRDAERFEVALIVESSLHNQVWQKGDVETLFAESLTRVDISPSRRSRTVPETH